MPAESKEPKYCYGLGFGHLSNVVEQLCKQLPTILNFTVDPKLKLLQQDERVINEQHIQVMDKNHVLFLGLLLAKKTIKLLLKAKGFAQQGKKSVLNYVLNTTRSVVDLGSLVRQAIFWPDYIKVLKQSFGLSDNADLKQLYLPIKNHLQQSFDSLCVVIIDSHVSNKNLHKNIHYLSIFLISKIPELILVVANNDVKNINSHSVSKYSLSDVDPKEETIRSDLLGSLSLLDTLQGNISDKIQIISESEQILHLVEKFYCIINLIYPWDLIAHLEKFF